MKRVVNFNVQYPCRGCKYFKACGDNMRTEYCAGRDYEEGIYERSKNIYLQRR